MTEKQFDKSDEFSRHETVNPQLLTINSIALQVGFDACGISKVENLHDQEEQLSRWLKNGYHGEMAYMERNVEKRLDPRFLVSSSKTIISVLLNYFPGNPDISIQSPKISRYALSQDYHTVVKDKLYQLLELLRKEFGKIDGRAFVDSAPVLEKIWAERAGLGWIGKNSLLINQKLGSYFFIGELIVDLEIETIPVNYPNRCGSCTRCIDACPTGAIVAPGVIDARKCISYLTIEKQSPLTDDEKESLNGWCFGCDICQEVCPWNGKVKQSNVKELEPKADILNLHNIDLPNLSKSNFDTIFKSIPVERAGFEKFKSIIS